MAYYIIFLFAFKLYKSIYFIFFSYLIWWFVLVIIHWFTLFREFLLFVIYYSWVFFEIILYFALLYFTVSSSAVHCTIPLPPLIHSEMSLFSRFSVIKKARTPFFVVMLFTVLWFRWIQFVVYLDHVCGQKALAPIARCRGLLD